MLADDVLSSLKLGAEATYETEVKTTMAASEGWGFEVLSTPELVRACERACSMVVWPHLSDGVSTVGVHVDIYHRAPARIGENLVTKAILIAVEGRRFRFQVESRVGSRIVGEGWHVSYLVDKARFENP